MNALKYTGLPIDIRVKIAMKHGVKIDFKKGVDLDYLFRKITELTGVSENEIKGKSRKQNVVEARKMFGYSARLLTNETMQKIGRYIGKDHSTISFYFKNVKEMKEVDKVYNEKVRAFIFNLNQTL